MGYEFGDMWRDTERRIEAKSESEESEDLFAPKFLQLENEHGQPLYLRTEQVSAVFFEGESVIVWLHDYDMKFRLSHASGTRALEWAEKHSVK